MGRACHVVSTPHAARVTTVKIESITIHEGMKKIFHFSSAGTKEIKVKDNMPDGYRYIEEYLNTSGFKILQVIDVHRFVLYKE